MGLHPPIVYRLPPPPDAEELARRARVQVDLERDRAERAARDDAMRPRRRELLQTGPRLGDVDTAVTCACVCHPRPADPALHDGGVSCPCQLTPEERAAALEAFFEVSGELGDELRVVNERRDTEFAAEVARLGVAARITVEAAPLVIVGEVDGRAFQFRERHGEWRVQITPDDDPLGDPEEWERAIRIASGDEDELIVEDQPLEVGALRVAVDAVRNALLRNSCSHERPRTDEDRYCSQCGVALARAAEWRWST